MNERINVNGPEMDRIITGNWEGDPTWYPDCEVDREEAAVMADVDLAYRQMSETAQRRCPTCNQMVTYWPYFGDNDGQPCDDCLQKIFGEES